jgi:hypothetical protein
MALVVETNNNNDWKDFLQEDVTNDTFTNEQNDLFDMYQVTQEQKRIFQSIKLGKNLFLSDEITDEEIIWNIGVVGIMMRNKKHNDFKFYRNSIVERLQRHDEAERRYKWHSGEWTKEAMRVLVEQ